MTALSRLPPGASKGLKPGPRPVEGSLPKIGTGTENWGRRQYLPLSTLRLSAAYPQAIRVQHVRACVRACLRACGRAVVRSCVVKLGGFRGGPIHGSDYGESDRYFHVEVVGEVEIGEDREDLSFDKVSLPHSLARSLTAAVTHSTGPCLPKSCSKPFYFSLAVPLLPTLPPTCPPVSSPAWPQSILPPSTYPTLPLFLYLSAFLSPPLVPQSL